MAAASAAEESQAGEAARQPTSSTNGAEVAVAPPPKTPPPKGKLGDSGMTSAEVSQSPANLAARAMGTRHRDGLRLSMF